MGLTERQQQYWSNTSRQIIKSIIKDCHKLMQSDRQEQSLYLLLLQEISLALNGNPVQKSILLISFEIYTNHLAAQQLNKNQMTEAIDSFTKLPHVEKILHELPAKIVLQLQQSGKITDINPRALVEASVVVPVEIIGEVDPRESFSDESDIDSLRASIHEWVEDHFSPIDKREQPNNERRQRRMDSLSRLLSLHKSISACFAVTLDVSTEPRLVMAANVGKNGTQTVILTEIESKLRMIQKYLTSVNQRKIGHCTPDELERLAEELMNQLLPTIAPLPWTLLQAAKKVIDVVCFDDDTFNETEKRAFLDSAPAVVIIPRMTELGAKMQVRHLCAREWIDIEIDLPKVEKCTAVKYIHAEQLLAYFLFVELQVQLVIKNPLIFGILKLCCQTCSTNLHRYNESSDTPVLTIRGSHGQTYKGVVDITSGHASKIESVRRAVTEPKSSPGDTPDKRARMKRKNDTEGVLMKCPANRCLFIAECSSIPEEDLPSMTSRVSPSLIYGLKTTQRHLFMGMSRQVTMDRDELSMSDLSLRESMTDQSSNPL